MFEIIETDKSVIWNSNPITPILTLADKYGGRINIIVDDNCYVCLLKKEDGTYSPIYHINSELHNALTTLESPETEWLKVLGF